MINFPREESSCPQRRGRPSSAIKTPHVRTLVYTSGGAEKPSKNALKCFFRTHRLEVSGKPKRVFGEITVWYRVVCRGSRISLSSAVHRKGLLVIY